MLWHCRLSDKKDIQPIEVLLHQFPQVHVCDTWSNFGKKIVRLNRNLRYRRVSDEINLCVGCRLVNLCIGCILVNLCVGCRLVVCSILCRWLSACAAAAIRVLLRDTPPAQSIQSKLKVDTCHKCGVDSNGWIDVCVDNFSIICPFFRGPVLLLELAMMPMSCEVLSSVIAWWRYCVWSVNKLMSLSCSCVLWNVPNYTVCSRECSPLTLSWEQKCLQWWTIIEQCGVVIASYHMDVLLHFYCIRESLVGGHFASVHPMHCQWHTCEAASYPLGVGSQLLVLLF